MSYSASTKIAEILIESSQIVFLSKEVLSEIFKNRIEDILAVKLLIRQANALNEKEITEYLSLLGDPYSLIPKADRKPLLAKTKENEMLIEIIKNYSYIGKIGNEENGYRINKRL